MIQRRYRTESHLKDHIIEVLTEERYKVTPIQTRTVPGVPDLFIAGRGHWYWMECKVLPTKLWGDGDIPLWKVPFRPGQQAWAYENYIVGGRPVICMVAFYDSIHYFLQRKVWSNREVPCSEFHKVLIQEIGDVLPVIMGDK